MREQNADAGGESMLVAWRYLAHTVPFVDVNGLCMIDAGLT